MMLINEKLLFLHSAFSKPNTSHVLWSAAHLSLQLHETSMHTTPATDSVSPWPGPAGACSRRLRTTRSHRSTSATSASPPSLRLPLISLSLVLVWAARCAPRTECVDDLANLPRGRERTGEHETSRVRGVRDRGARTNKVHEQPIARVESGTASRCDPPPIDTHALQCTQKERNVHLTAQR